MYAIIRAGGKQYKVREGDMIDVERIKGDDSSVEFTPLLVVHDGGSTVSGKDELASARVRATVVGESKGPKIEILKFRNKTGYRRHTGHRQKYSTIQIAAIEVTGAKRQSRRTRSEEVTDGA